MRGTIVHARERGCMREKVGLALSFLFELLLLMGAGFVSRSLKQLRKDWLEEALGSEQILLGRNGPFVLGVGAP